MWMIFPLILLGFGTGLYLKLPYHLLDPQYMALIFLALLDSLTFALVRDLQKETNTNRLVFLRLSLSLLFGAFIIYFGQKSGVDLLLVALIPLTFGLALNLYKFLPK